jgi:acetyl-CoA carboxylase biotin carboxyl carrier protein
MAGTLLELKVKAGDTVAAGAEIAIVESMKMEVPITSPVAGRVARVLKNPGDFLNDGDTVVELA